MTPADDLRMYEALDWARRIHDPDFADWDTHLVWLEMNPGNVDAFNRACLMIEGATVGLTPGALPTKSTPVNDNEGFARLNPRNWGQWVVGFGATAAAVMLGVVGMPMLMPAASRPYVIETAQGQTREIAIAGGTRITLNGGSAVRLDHANIRLATLEKGEAFFVVVHDAVHPFTVHADDAIFQDVGTSFDVTLGAATQIAVREGAVLYDPNGSAVRLNGGQSMSIERSGATVRQVVPAGVGGWRNGQLTYHDAPLSTIAADVARSTGQSVTVERSIAARTFSGVIILDADRSRMFRRIAGVTGVAIRRDPSGWHMVSPAP